ncbi:MULTISPECIES: hypothetical protein [Bradyrhizobium]|uniref:hypothetical protein n=1 Tax=Bradyrhizobium TaxID=374 RepID=UPI0004B76EC7|nr:MULTISPECIES: hypothetical protein [Bradyrhizobium]MCA1530818.1 hypothetical protein [Bradyrhizobium yuanmingense]UWU93691.1 hypothetical protein N2604_07405 [Bradyrhizobium sp. CB1015]
MRSLTLIAAAHEHPYLYLDGIVMKRSWAGEVRNVSLLVGLGGQCRGVPGDPRHL